MIYSVLSHCADNKNRGLSALPNVGHQIEHIKIAGILHISRLRVNNPLKNVFVHS
jgi:hypothetical protein